MSTHTETSRPSNIAGSKIPRITSRQEDLVGESDVVGPVPAILKFKSILVPIDFSKISRKALDYAVPLAKHFGAKITLLHAIEPPPYSADLTYVPMGEGFPIGPLKKELDALAKNTSNPSS